MTAIRRLMISDSEADQPIMISDTLREVIQLALAQGNAFYHPDDYFEIPHEHYRSTPVTIPPNTIYRDQFEAHYFGFYGWERIDLLHVHTGELILNLSDGRVVTLQAGDMFVVNSFLQSCRNPGIVPAKAIAIALGGE